MNAAFDGRAAAQNYTRAFRRLGQLDGFDQQALLRAEAGVILKTWAGRTKVAKPAELNYRARYRAEKRAFGYTNARDNPYGISVNTGRGGGFPGEVWFRTRNKKYQQAGVVANSGAFTPAWRHFRSADWQRIKQGATRYGDELAKLLPLSQQSAGLARQSVIQIADELGIDLLSVRGGGTLSAAGIAKARAAIASSGRAYRNGRGAEGGDGVRCHIELINRLPYGTKIDMDRTLAGVLSGRAKFIETAYQKGAFENVRKAAAAFPNLYARN